MQVLQNNEAKHYGLKALHFFTMIYIHLMLLSHIIYGHRTASYFTKKLTILRRTAGGRRRQEE